MYVIKAKGETLNLLVYYNIGTILLAVETIKTIASRCITRYMYIVKIT